MLSYNLFSVPAPGIEQGYQIQRVQCGMYELSIEMSFLWAQCPKSEIIFSVVTG